MEQKNTLFKVGKEFEIFKRIGLVTLRDVPLLTDYRSKAHVQNLLEYAKEEQ